MGKCTVIMRLCCLGVLLLVQTACSCTAPLDRAASQLEMIREQLPTMEEADLLCVDEFGRLSKQGIGTHVGQILLYGVDQDYQQVVDFYRGALTLDGWVKFDRTTWDHPWYCNPQHQGVRIELRSVASDAATCDDPGFGDTGQNYQTFYVLDVRNFPFDDIGGCGPED